LYCTASCCLYHSSLIRTPSSPAYSSRHTRYRTRQRRPLRHPPYRRRSRRVTRVIILITSYSIPSVCVTLRAGLTATSSSLAYSSRHTRYCTPWWRALCHPPHRRRSRRISHAIVLITSYSIPSVSVTLRAGLTAISSSPAYSSRHSRYRTRRRRALRHPPHRCRRRHMSLAIVLITSYSIPSVSVTLRAGLTTPSSPAISSHLTRYRTRRRRPLRRPHRHRAPRITLDIVLIVFNFLLSLSLCATNIAKLVSILVTAYSLSYSPLVT
jgi:hypothetical protein